MINEKLIGEELVEEFDSSKFSPSKSRSTSRVSLDSGILSVINSKENGKRITLSKELLEKLNNPEQLQFAFANDAIAIGEELLDSETYFYVKTSGKKGIVYASGLVNEITKEFSLDFSDRVCITFYEVKYLSNGEYPVAIIKIK